MIIILKTIKIIKIRLKKNNKIIYMTNKKKTQN